MFVCITVYYDSRNILMHWITNRRICWCYFYNTSHVFIHATFIFVDFSIQSQNDDYNDGDDDDDDDDEEQKKGDEENSQLGAFISWEI